jgi:hypothetical protein
MYDTNFHKVLVLMTQPRYEKYQECLIDHLMAVTLKHWDVNMRKLGALSLRRISEVDIKRLGPRVATRAVGNLFCLDFGLTRYRKELLLRSFEASEVHGGLSALSELAASFKARAEQDLEQERFKVCVAINSFD